MHHSVIGAQAQLCHNVSTVDHKGFLSPPNDHSSWEFSQKQSIRSLHLLILAVARGNIDEQILWCRIIRSWFVTVGFLLLPSTYSVDRENGKRKGHWLESTKYLLFNQRFVFSNWLMIISRLTYFCILWSNTIIEGENVTILLYVVLRIIHPIDLPIEKPIMQSFFSHQYERKRYDMSCFV